MGVQNGSCGAVDWMLELSEGTKKSKGKQTQEPSKQAASQACQSRLKVND